MLSAASLDVLPPPAGEAGGPRAAALRPLLRTAGLTRSYGSREAAVAALRGVDLTVRPGEFVIVFGRSGSGKSTLLGLLGLLDLPSGGQCLFSERDSAAMSPDERAMLRTHEIGFVFQDAHLLPRYTAQENVELALVYAGGCAGRAQPARRRSPGHSRARPPQASQAGRALRGEQQRVALARAIVKRPALILADEPTGALDSHTGREVMELLRGLNDAGQTIVMVTHDVELVRYGDRAVVMRDGLILEQIPVREGERAKPARSKPAGHGSTQSRAARLKEALQSAWCALRTTPAPQLLDRAGRGGGDRGRDRHGRDRRRRPAPGRGQIASLGTNLLLVLPGSAETKA